MQNLKLERFEGTGKRYEKRITITKSYSIGLPTTFFEENRIEKFNYAVLFFDSKNQVVGVKFTNDDNEKGRIVIIKNEKYGGHIQARTFMKANNIDPIANKGRYVWEKKNIEGIGDVYLFELKK